MKINVGIVEDEKIYKEQLIQILDQWGLETCCEMIYSTATSGEAFLSKLPKEMDILFLDIQLTKMNGVELAHELRKKQIHCEIVFLTAYREYVFQGYQVRALNYLLKPISYLEIKKCMNFIYERLKVEHYVFRKQQNIYKIPYSDILYFSSSKHYVDIKTMQTTYRQLEPLKNILTHLPLEFMQCHRTTIVNIHHIQCINGNNITMSDNVILPVSKTYLPSIRNGILKSII